MEIEVKVAAILTNQMTGLPVVVLVAREPHKPFTAHDVLPIEIGPLEAGAIARQFTGIQPPRPQTHDLMKNLLGKYEVSLKKVVITDLKDNTFYAMLHLEWNGTVSTMDCRPSDAIALGLRTDSPIYVESDVFEKSRRVIEEKMGNPLQGSVDMESIDWNSVQKD